MKEAPFYISSIPENAREKDVTEEEQGHYPGQVVKNYYLGRRLVGKRVFDKNGVLEYECPYKNGKRHGWVYEWYPDGGLVSALPYDNGREHGTATVWGESGAFLGSYTMEHGTGIDFWWQETEGKAQLTEARVIVDNQWDGYEYWFSDHPGELVQEKWWSKGQLHGIEREWNNKGRLRRGFPKYWIHDVQVDKRKYLRALKVDTTLIPFHIEDNQPYRIFPKEVAAHLPPELPEE